mmetsp:Transcript_24692/g.62197  ORF Transcript_24692/g.62197 Transcript_24692/m.62197 type:complete len:228 (+) Transcript_24692:873-1556(+)
MGHGALRRRAHGQRRRARRARGRLRGGLPHHLRAPAAAGGPGARGAGAVRGAVLHDGALPRPRVRLHLAGRPAGRVRPAAVEHPLDAGAAALRPRHRADAGGVLRGPPRRAAGVPHDPHVPLRQGPPLRPAVPRQVQRAAAGGGHARVVRALGGRAERRQHTRPPLPGLRRAQGALRGHLPGAAVQVLPAHAGPRDPRGAQHAAHRGALPQRPQGRELRARVDARAL